MGGLNLHKTRGWCHVTDGGEGSGEEATRRSDLLLLWFSQVELTEISQWNQREQEVALDAVDGQRNISAFVTFPDETLILKVSHCVVLSGPRRKHLQHPCSVWRMQMWHIPQLVLFHAADPPRRSVSKTTALLTTNIFRKGVFFKHIISGIVSLVKENSPFKE